MAKQDMRELVFQGIGEASLCWSEGVFDSCRAKAIGERIIARIEELERENERLQRWASGMTLTSPPDEYKRGYYNAVASFRDWAKEGPDK